MQEVTGKPVSGTAMTRFFRRPFWVAAAFTNSSGPGRYLLASMLVFSTLSGCGGGGGDSGGGATVTNAAPAAVSPSSSGPNVQPVVVDAGPTGRSVNVLFTAVTVCMPGNPSACQTIDHVIVDTGSSGLRLLSDVVTLPLPKASVNGNQPLLNCVQFLDQSYLWGPVANADLFISGERAPNLPLQLAGDSSFPAAPATCATSGIARHSLATLGAKGVLGIGTQRQDCGTFCASRIANGFYYAFTGSALTGTAVSTALQLQQPVSLFNVNNNGSTISLPAVPDRGASSVAGALVFGLGTLPNNSTFSPTVLPLNSSGFFTTTVAGRSYPRAFLDSGTNGFFFGTAEFPVCAGGWYCPAVTTVLLATNTAVNGVSGVVNLVVANAASLFANNSVRAFNNLAAPVGDSTSFGFGIPFFYGRNVSSAIEGKPTHQGVGPYVAY